jgi:hypothetical protein
MCDKCREYAKRVVVLKELLLLFREWFADRSCRFKPRGMLTPSQVDTDKCFADCGIEDLIGKFDEFLEKNKKVG